MNRVDKIYSEKPEPARFARAYLDYIAELLSRIDENEVGDFINALMEARERGTRVFFIGNGGSAATASHFVDDIAIGTKTLEKPFRAMSLTDNVPVITAIANDMGYDEIFVQQLKTMMDPGDIVVAISASGNSPNLVKAVKYANENGGVTVGLTGFDGGELRRICKYGIHIETAKGEYGPVEDIHMILDHVSAACLMHAVAAEKVAV